MTLVVNSSMPLENYLERERGVRNPTPSGPDFDQFNPFRFAVGVNKGSMPCGICVGTHLFVCK